MAKAILMGFLVFALTLPVYADDFDDDDAELYATVLNVDISMYQATPGKVKKAIYLAFLNRGWIVDSVQDKRFIGSYGLIKRPMKAQFIIKDDNTVTISTVPKADQPSTAWLGNLRKDFLVRLVEQIDFK